MSSRDTRRARIKRIVRQQRVGSQAELVGLLRQAGVNCTQATLSRDLRSMGIVRRSTPAGPAYALDNGRNYSEAVRRVVGMEITAIEHSENLVVVRTLPGRAQGVAAFIDSLDEEDILGTVAGDDTVFVAPRSVSRVGALVAKIQRLESADLEDSL